MNNLKDGLGRVERNVEKVLDAISPIASSLSDKRD